VATRLMPPSHRLGKTATSALERSTPLSASWVVLLEPRIMISIFLSLDAVGHQGHKTVILTSHVPNTRTRPHALSPVLSESQQTLYCQ
jgi:hypothetical protein